MNNITFTSFTISFWAYANESGIILTFEHESKIQFMVEHYGDLKIKITVDNKEPIVQKNLSI